MGPESAQRFPGQQLVYAAPRPPTDGQAQVAERAKQEIDYGRRGKGDIFGAFLAPIEAWIPAEVTRVDAIMDNLQAHRATEVLLFALAYPRWGFVFQPQDAAYLNLIEPWWKVLRSLALKGRRFETWEEVWGAVEVATTYWNGHRHPFVWGRRRRHRPRRRPGIAAVPGIRRLTG